jgi:hypothetical protein
MKKKKEKARICLDFGYCGSKKIRAYGFFYLENLFFNSFTTQKHLKNTLNILLNSLMALKNIKNPHKNLKSIRNKFFFPSLHLFFPPSILRWKKNLSGTIITEWKPLTQKLTILKAIISVNDDFFSPPSKSNYSLFLSLSSQTIEL